MRKLIIKANGYAVGGRDPERMTYLQCEFIPMLGELTMV